MPAPEPILSIPAHIAAMPEPEQGPALVAEIHQRRRWRQAIDEELAARQYERTKA